MKHSPTLRRIPPPPQNPPFLLLVDKTMTGRGAIDQSNRHVILSPCGVRRPGSQYRVVARRRSQKLYANIGRLHNCFFPS